MNFKQKIKISNENFSIEGTRIEKNSFVNITIISNDVTKFYNIGEIYLTGNQFVLFRFPKDENIPDENMEFRFFEKKEFMLEKTWTRCGLHILNYYHSIGWFGFEINLLTSECRIVAAENGWKQDGYGRYYYFSEEREEKVIVELHMSEDYNLGLRKTTEDLNYNVKEIDFFDFRKNGNVEKIIPNFKNDVISQKIDSSDNLFDYLSLSNNC